MRKLKECEIFRDIGLVTMLFLLFLNSVAPLFCVQKAVNSLANVIYDSWHNNFDSVNLVSIVYFDCTFSDWAQPTPLPTS